MTDKKLTEEQLQALQTMGASLSTLAIPPATIFPFQDLLQNITKIKQKEAQRMFPGADPSLFKGVGDKAVVNLIPQTQKIAQARLYNVERFSSAPTLVKDNIYESAKFFPEYLSTQPGTPSPELGSYQQAIANKTIFPEGDIQAITVTPGPNSARFAQDYAEILGDKLGKTINQFESSEGWNAETARLGRKIDTLSAKIPGQTAGYIWGNTNAPQYTYAEGNWGQGQRLAGTNPSIYVSRINADPSKEAQYLYTKNIKIDNPADTEKNYLTVDPRARFKQYEELGPGTGPSWGLGSSGDMHFRKDLIGARGELTTGDLQALLAERGLPFVYQRKKETPTKGRLSSDKKPGDILQENLEALAKAENITTSQAIERFARLVPNVGEPSTPPTEAIAGKVSRFPAQGQDISPFGSFASKTDLRQIGILPPADKASYTAFKVDEFDKLFKYEKPRYNASNIAQLNTYTTPIDPLDPFGEAEEGLSELIINRDKLRPQAANKLLDRTVKNLVEQSKPIQGLGLGGLTTGAIATAMDPAVINALARGDYAQAGTTAAVNTAVGSAVGGATAKGLQALRAAGYARPAAMVGSVLPAAGGVLAGLGAVETGKALNRVYRAQTGKDWVTRNEPATPYSTYIGPTPTIEPRMGTAILGGKPVQVPYGSVAGEKKVGRPWWDKAGSRIQKFADLLNAGSVIGR
jgi:hypothetical protein